MKLLKILFILLSFLQPLNSYALPAFPPDYEKKRLIISTDIGGGDKDDTQSMIHFLAYANMFDLEGIIISRPKGRLSEMRRVLRAYRRDYTKFISKLEGYPTPAELEKLIKIGAERDIKSPEKGYSRPTEGSSWIVKQARKLDARPLHIVAWGSTTDVAQAIYNAPSIKKKILLYAGGTRGYNYDLEPAPTDFLRSIVNSDLRWIDANGAGAGLYCTDLKSPSKYSNVGFVSKVIKHRGALGRLFYSVSAFIDVNKYGLKMGDSVSILFLLNGDFNNPAKSSWSGKYCKLAKNRYAECPNQRLCGKEGAKAVAKHRVDILKDWENRLISIYDQ